MSDAGRVNSWTVKNAGGAGVNVADELISGQSVQVDPNLLGRVGTVYPFNKVDEKLMSIFVSDALTADIQLEYWESDA